MAIGLLGSALSVVGGTFAASAGEVELTSANAKVTSRVRADTPPWTLEVVFTLDDFSRAADCASAPNPWLIWYFYQGPSGGGEAVVSGDVGKTDACAPSQVQRLEAGDDQVVVEFDLLQYGDGYIPSADGNDLGTVVGDSPAEIRTLLVRGRLTTSPGGHGGESSLLQLRPDIDEVELPTKPIWIGLGDGYTSQVVQNREPNASDPDCLLSAPLDGCYDPNWADPAGMISWVRIAVRDINDNKVSAAAAGQKWWLDASIEARDGATTATLDSQVQTAQSKLQSRVVHRGADPSTWLPSWNWVSVSAGLVDIGVPGIMRTYSTVTHPYLTDATRPWDAPAGSCPNLASAKAAVAVEATSHDMRTRLLQAVASLRSEDPSSRIVQVLYPDLVEQGNVCWDSVMRDLRSSIDITDLPAASYAAAGIEPAGIVDINLQEVFKNEPTGTAPERYESRLWLTRPYGYPYPGSSATEGITARVRELFVDSAPTLGWDVGPGPTGFSPLDEPWWNANSVTVTWHPDDDRGLAAPVPTSTVVTAEGVTAVSAAAIEDETLALYGARTTRGEVPIRVDRSTPTGIPTFMGATPIQVGGVAWFGPAALGDLVVRWDVSDAKPGIAVSGLSEIDGGEVDEPGALLGAYVSEVPIRTGVNTVPGPTVSDLAGNEATLPPVIFRVDAAGPELALEVWVRKIGETVFLRNQPAGNGTYGTGGVEAIELRWVADDGAHGVGVKRGDVIARSMTVKTLSVSPTAPSVTTTADAVDAVGNPGTGSRTILVTGAAAQTDITEPETLIVGMPTDPTNSTALSAFRFAGDDDGAAGADTDQTPFTFRCSFTSAGPWASCPATGWSGSVGEGRHTVWVDATDRAGNRDRTPASYTWLVDTTPPRIDWTKVFLVDGKAVVLGGAATDPAGSGGATASGVQSTVCVPATAGGIACTITDRAGNVFTATNRSVVVAAGVGDTSFVVGDMRPDKRTLLAVGDAAYFWGSQWENHNWMSADQDHDAFKGYADTLVRSAAGAATNWTTKAGNSKPPAKVPTYLVVLVSSSIGKTQDPTKRNSSSPYGNVIKRAIVLVDSKYSNNPGHVGTGKIVAFLS